MIPRQILDNLEIRILLVTPDEGDYVLVSNLASGFRHGRHLVEWSNSYEHASGLIAKEEHDVYLVLNRLNDHIGLNLVRDAIVSGSHAPFIVLTRSEARSVGPTRRG